MNKAMQTIKKLLFAVATLICLTASAADATPPKYIFYFIGDGMGMGPTVATEMYNRHVLGNDTPITMMQFPVSGFCLTYSASSPVTDSAAAGTALSTGTKTKNSMLGMNPDTIPVYSIATILKSDGYGVGIATSVAPDDATPGAFYAHVPSRNMAYQIDLQAAQSGYEFLAGARLRGTKDKDGNPTDIMEVMEANNVKVVYGMKELSETTAEKVFLLNTPGHDKDWNIGYTIDSIADALTLPIITQACLDHLLRVSPEKFFMMVEGGNIDHALHANDGGAAIKEILNFNQAIDIAYQFYKQHPDETLIVVTADHDTGGMTIVNPHLGYNAHLEIIDYQRHSKEGFEDYCKKTLENNITPTWPEMKEYLTQHFGMWKQVPITEKQEALLKETFDNTFEKLDSEDERTLYANFNQFVKTVYKTFNDVAGIGFVATSHTGNPVPVFAVGDGASAFSSLNNNIEIPEKILKLVNGK